MKTRFITYGDKSFNLQKKHLLNLAVKSTLFDEVLGYDQNDIDTNFYNKYSEIFNYNKGGGYWIWKYQIITQSLRELQNGDMLIYSDSGSSLNVKGKKRFYEYLEMLKESDHSTIRFQVDYLEKYWATKEIFKYFNIDIDSQIANSKQFLAGHIIMKKNDLLLEQLDVFKKLLEYDKYLITDKYDSEQIDGFQQNRHDQSIFSVISKLYGCIALENEVWFNKNLADQYAYPFLAVQQRGYTSYQKIKFYSQYFKHINSPIYFGEKIYSYQKPSLLKKIKYKLNNN